MQAGMGGWEDFFPSLPRTPEMVCALPGSKSILSTVQARLPSYMKH